MSETEQCKKKRTMTATRTSIYKVRDWVRKKFPAIYQNTIYLCMNEHPAIVDFIKYDYNIDPEDLYWYAVSMNPAMIELIKENKKLIHYDGLSMNPSPEAFKILLESPDKISWINLSKNPAPAAVEYLFRFPDKIDWRYFSENPAPAAVKYLIENPDHIEWVNFSRNTSPLAVQYMRKNLDKLNWYNLSLNEAAISILLENTDKIVWEPFLENQTPEAIELIRAKNKVDYNSMYTLSCNPAAIELLKEQKEICDFVNIMANSAIFECDYKWMRESREQLHRDFIAELWSPRRVAAELNAGAEIDDLENMYDKSD